MLRDKHLHLCVFQTRRLLPCVPTWILLGEVGGSLFTEHCRALALREVAGSCSHLLYPSRVKAKWHLVLSFIRPLSWKLLPAPAYTHCAPPRGRQRVIQYCPLQCPTLRAVAGPCMHPPPLPGEAESTLIPVLCRVPRWKVVTQSGPGSWFVANWVESPHLGSRTNQFPCSNSY